MATYAGQHKDGYACGVGVTTWVNGDRVYAEHDPKGEVDGRHLSKIANGDKVYRLYEHGRVKVCAVMRADGRCSYTTEDSFDHKELGDLPRQELS
jgi:hypothetical protein